MARATRWASGGVEARAGKFPGPSLIPVTITLNSDRGPSRTFNFGVVRDPLFTPLMTYAALLNTLSSYERQFGATMSASADYVHAMGRDQFMSFDLNAGLLLGAIVPPLTVGGRVRWFEVVFVLQRSADV